jgi:hypothetical protein
VILVSAPAAYDPVFCFTRIKPEAGIAAPVAVEAAVRDACTHISFPDPDPLVIMVFHAGTFPDPPVYGIIQIAVPSIFTIPPREADRVIVPRDAEVVWLRPTRES